MAQLPNAPSQIVCLQALEQTQHALRQAPEDLARAAKHLAGERALLVMIKAEELWQAKSDLSQAENSATMAAYGAGAANGKNQAERDVQLTDYLAKDPAVQAARATLRGVELRLAACEAVIEAAEADYRVSWARLSAARADAALQTAYLSLLATGEKEEQAEYETADIFGTF